MLVSLLWTRRNQLRVGELELKLKMINVLALDKLCEFRIAYGTSSLAPRVAVHANWLPLPKDWMKVNFDSATFQEECCAGLGCVIRNDEGLVMATLSQIIPLPTSVEMVEVLAARSAIDFAQDLNLKKVIFEGDFATIIKALSKGGFDSSSFGHIIKDIKLLSHAFQNESFCHIRRQGNRVAHSLA
ncbi:uncharacterized protein LOC112009202 [Quercus suber]|uniref:uncharacterized protein LOC112009202 n=1 Tax=Quercus suber TaxID=58331 RepID=UPI000CE26DFF|nr:uncharacterized protein LOC112009202 [Quercus suber]